MSDPAPKRRWFRFRLRTLFVMMTVLVLVACFTARALRLESQARFHDRQADNQREYFYFRIPIDPLNHPPSDEAADRKRAAAYRTVMRWHRVMARKYRAAIWLPWLLVTPNEPEPPDPEPHLQRRTYPPGRTICDLPRPPALHTQVHDYPRRR